MYTRAVPLRLPRSGACGCVLRLVEHEAHERRDSPATWSFSGILGDAIQITSLSSHTWSSFHNTSAALQEHLAVLCSRSTVAASRSSG